MLAETQLYKRLLQYIIVFVLVAYFIAAVIGYMLVGLHMVYWHVHIMAYVYLTILAYYSIRLIFKNNKLKIDKYFKSYCSIAFGFLFVEIWIMLFEPNLTDFGRYNANYETKRASYYHTWSSDHRLKKPEFDYYRSINSLGFSDYEWSIEKPSGTKRILCLGDSFTEGDGAHYDSTYVSFLRASLKQDGYSVELMNAGVCGSDPFFYYKNLNDRLLKYKPDIVVMTISEHDFTNEIAIRGGLERFLPNGKLRYRNPPPFETIYAVSYISRIFFTMAGYDYALLRPDPERDKNDIMLVKDLYARFNLLAEENNFKVIVAILPSLLSLTKDEVHFNLSEIESYANTLPNFSVVDLKDCYLSKTNNDIKIMKELYWKIDNHHNAKGYKMVADCVYPLVKLDL